MYSYMKIPQFKKPKQCHGITRLLFFTLFVFAIHTESNGQSDTTSRWGRLLERLLQENKPANKPRIAAFPTFAFSPETNLELGVASALLYHAKNDVENNRLCEITAFTFVTLRSQYGLWIDNAVYSDRDRWLLLGRSRFQRFPLLYYGVGPDASSEEPDVVDGFGAQLRHRAFRRVSHNLFAGPQFDFQALNRVEFGEDGIARRPLPVGAGGSANFGIGAGLAYDSRPNALNTRNGWFAELGWLRYDAAIGSDFEFDNFNADIRWYKSFLPKQVLAAQFVGNIVSGEAPFNQMSLLGSETMMRGYYNGRYRDKQFYALQAEYRWLPFPFSKRIGAAAFLGAGAVAPRISVLSSQDVRLAGGAGLRFLLFPKKDIFLRFDLGFTQEGTGLYIFSGEAF
jgi:Omp85 superfamily domain